MFFHCVVCIACTAHECTNESKELEDILSKWWELQARVSDVDDHRTQWAQLRAYLNKT